MSSGVVGTLECHSNVTPCPNGTDLVEGCVFAVSDLHESYGGGAF
jgi:hypothetical protein